MYIINSINQLLNNMSCCDVNTTAAIHYFQYVVHTQDKIIELEDYGMWNNLVRLSNVHATGRGGGAGGLWGDATPSVNLETGVFL